MTCWWTADQEGKLLDRVTSSAPCESAAGHVNGVGETSRRQLTLGPTASATTPADKVEVAFFVGFELTHPLAQFIERDVDGAWRVAVGEPARSIE